MVLSSKTEEISINKKMLKLTHLNGCTTGHAQALSLHIQSGLQRTGASRRWTAEPPGGPWRVAESDPLPWSAQTA